MFDKACNHIRETIYGLIGLSQISPTQVNASNGTGFMIAPGILAAAAHLCHVDNNPIKPRHQIFEAIRSPDIGQKMETATFVAEDTERDIALLRLTAPRSSTCVTLETNRIASGTNCGSLGFPLASVVFSQTGRLFNLVERFQSASISAFLSAVYASGRQLERYETDAFMYKGSSGCPGFLENGRVFGMHISSVTEQSGGQNPQARVAIANWIPAIDIKNFATASGAVL